MRVEERLLKYVSYWTTSDEECRQIPSSERQFELGKVLEQELRDLGLEKVTLTDHCYVYGLLPATKGYADKPAVGFISHMDTAPDFSGKDVKPQIIPDYDGNDVLLKGSGAYLKVSDFPTLKTLKGRTLITTDGTTLLGADDKAGVSEIMTAVEQIITEKIPHGDIWIGFTPDEEVGSGADLFDLDYFKARFAYTVDGDYEGEVAYENFNAAAAVVTVHGFSVHPGSAKGTMINAQNVAMEFHAALPAFSRPEHTEGREGFFHLTSMQGDVTTAHLGYIVRDHDAAKFAARKAQMQHIAACLNDRYGAGTVELDIKDSYYNMLEKIQPHFHLVENARKAIRAAGLEPIETPVRGGTDGARLSYMGLPCPNLCTGGYNYHGKYEFIPVDSLQKTAEILVKIASLFS